MKIQDLRSFLAKALVKISCKTQSAQHNKQTKCEYMKGDLMHLFGPITVSNLLASVQVQYAYKDHFWFAHKGWLVWPCFHQPACTSIYITSDRQVGSTTSWGLKEIACFVCNHLPLLRLRDLVQWIMSTPYCPMLSTTSMTTSALQNLTY